MILKIKIIFRKVCRIELCKAWHCLTIYSTKKLIWFWKFNYIKKRSNATQINHAYFLNNLFAYDSGPDWNFRGGSQARNLLQGRNYLCCTKQFFMKPKRNLKGTSFCVLRQHVGYFVEENAFTSRDSGKNAVTITIISYLIVSN